MEMRGARSFYVRVLHGLNDTVPDWHSCLQSSIRPNLSFLMFVCPNWLLIAFEEILFSVDMFCILALFLIGQTKNPITISPNMCFLSEKQTGNLTFLRCLFVSQMESTYLNLSKVAFKLLSIIIYTKFFKSIC